MFLLSHPELVSGSVFPSSKAEDGGPLTVDPRLFVRSSLTSGDVLRRITSAPASLLISGAGGPLTDKAIYSQIFEDLPGSLSPSYDKIRLAV
jgi:hypothetical protein